MKRWRWIRIFEKLLSNDPILNQSPFTNAEAQYNIIHVITGKEQSNCFKSSDGRMIFAQSPGGNAWVWADYKNDEEATKLIHNLIKYLLGVELPGLSGEPKFIERLAKSYANSNGVTYEVNMMMESYFCPSVIRPAEVDGSIVKASDQDVETVAQFIAGFSNDAYGSNIEPSSQLTNADRMIGTGNLYLWRYKDTEPVSMANIAHRSARHARINAVYTAPQQRNNGFGSIIVAHLCEIVLQENLTPMLYSDLKNQNSNKIYRKIGFVESGKVADIRFS